MQYTILLDRNENTKEAEAQEQGRFVKSILEALEIPTTFNPEQLLTVEDKIQLRKDLAAFNINIIDDMNGGLKIYVEKEVIAEWNKPKYILKTDHSQVDPRKRLYLEMHVSISSIFEEETQ